MRPFDQDTRTYEQKIEDAAREAGVTLSGAEVASLKQRIKTVIFEASPNDLTVAQLTDWVKRITPGMRHAHATIDQHVALAGNEQPDPQHAGLFPDELLRRLAEGNDPYHRSPDNQHEVVCTLVGGRKVRMNPANLVVTPLRTSK